MEAQPSSNTSSNGSSSSSNSNKIEVSKVTDFVVDLDHLSLPKVTKDYLDPTLYFYQNFWCPSFPLFCLLSSEENKQFKALDTDILIATKPKSGTTWLKSLTFSIINRGKYPPRPSSSSSSPKQQLSTDDYDHPLLNQNPHHLVLSLEHVILIPRKTQFGDFSETHPSLYSTHLPHHALPESIKTSACKIVYLCRNPLDTLISLWHFVRREGETEEESSRNLEQMIHWFCEGIEECGPHWDHVLGYWRESLDKPRKVLFMRYEEMKTNEKSEIKRLAEFIGHPFTLEEEKAGVIENISSLCSLRSLKDLKVNQSGNYTGPMNNNKFFRKGEVGDWVNHLTPSMADRLKNVLQQKFDGTGFYW